MASDLVVFFGWLVGKLGVGWHGEAMEFLGIFLYAHYIWMG